MLEEILAYINNWFERERVCNDFVIEGGAFAKPIGMLQDGQYYLIKGSIFNDGLHQWPSTDLVDEEFTGMVEALAVPRAVLDLADSIAEWQDKYGDAVAGPYQSESFNNYSYTKKSSQSAPGGSEVMDGWRTVYQHQLNRWRKL